MKHMEVKVPAVDQSSYPIYIGCSNLGQALPMINEKYPGKSKYIVTDSNVANAGIVQQFDRHGEIEIFVIDPPGEISKTIDTVIKITETMEKSYLGRDSVVIAIGGGTVGDMAGFAASIFKRGVPVVQIPTTTVAQADSAVGGKTGVDSSLSKNAFGTFHYPQMVFIDVETLIPLDKRQYLAGLVESVKHALIADETYFAFIEENIDKLLLKDLQILEAIAQKNCRIKARIVEEDPTEKNQRRILNYGHTIGHAIESASNFRLLHGEAVGIGIIGAGLIEKKLGLSSDMQFERVKSLLENLQVPTKIPGGVPADKILELIKRDKKAINKWPLFVLIDQIGKARCVNGLWAHEVDQKLIENILPELY